MLSKEPNELFIYTCNKMVTSMGLGEAEYKKNYFHGIWSDIYCCITFVPQNQDRAYITPHYPISEHASSPKTTQIVYRTRELTIKTKA